ncbi:hypothetical protein J6590_082178 [Homalodisca vitripennis]|nr:hypothetical protein J6590_082178 [Homalodisca vitripennis]
MDPCDVTAQNRRAQTEEVLGHIVRDTRTEVVRKQCKEKRPQSRTLRNTSTKSDHQRRCRCDKGSECRCIVSPVSGSALSLEIALCLFVFSSCV